MSTTQTITVLYYEDDILLELKSMVIHNCEVGAGGRVIIPMKFKEDKLIVAVLLGEVVVLNKLADRTSLSFRAA
jgi:hypothetical protein